MMFGPRGVRVRIDVVAYLRNTLLAYVHRRAAGIGPTLVPEAPSGLVYGRQFQSCTHRTICTSKHDGGFYVCEKLAVTSLADVCLSTGAPGLVMVCETCGSTGSSATAGADNIPEHQVFRSKFQVGLYVMRFHRQARAAASHPDIRSDGKRHQSVIGVTASTRASWVCCRALCGRSSNGG